MKGSSIFLPGNEGGCRCRINSKPESTQKQVKNQHTCGCSDFMCNPTCVGCCNSCKSCSYWRNR